VVLEGLGDLLMGSSRQRTGQELPLVQERLGVPGGWDAAVKISRKLSLMRKARLSLEVEPV